MNKISISKVLVIGIYKIDPMPSYLKSVHFRQESIGVGLDCILQLNVVIM